MKNVSSSLILLLLLSFASCKSLQRPPRANGSSSPKVEHDLLQGKDDHRNTHERTREDTKVTSRTKITKRKEKDLMDFIEEWYGTPHRMGGTTKKGVDCSGFVIVAYREVFKREFRGRRAEDLFAEMERVKWDDLEYGDLVFFKVKGRRIDHVGIYVGDGNFAHTSASRGVMISALNNPYWSKRYFKAGRYKS